MKAIRVYEIGGPEKLIYDDLPLPSPGPGQARIKIRSIGLNFIDVYFRTGLYKSALPFTPGMEAAGTVESIGEEVTVVKPGDRVAYAGAIGAYAEYSLVNASQLVNVPDDVDFQSAAAVMLQGITAHYLTHSAFPLKKSETLLIHAASGGVGLLLIQMARKIGAKIIGTVSTEEKASRARDAGADEIIFYTRDDFEQEVKRITSGAGVDVVYDSVGRTTFEKGLNCLKRRGMMVLFGQSSGSVAPIDPGILNAKGSIYLTRPGLAHYTATREELLWRTGAIFRWISEKSLKIHIDQTFALKEAARAHQALEARKTAGKVLIQP